MPAGGTTGKPPGGPEWLAWARDSGKFLVGLLAALVYGVIRVAAEAFYGKFRLSLLILLLPVALSVLAPEMVVFLAGGTGAGVLRLAVATWCALLSIGVYGLMRRSCPSWNVMQISKPWAFGNPWPCSPPPASSCSPWPRPRSGRTAPCPMARAGPWSSSSSSGPS